MTEALAGYEARRNAVAMPIYEFICQLTTLEVPAEMQALFGALRDNPRDTGRLFGVMDGTVPAAEFFAPDNVGRIMAATQPDAA